MKKMTAKEKEAFAKKATDDEEQALWEKKRSLEKIRVMSTKANSLRTLRS